MFADFERKIVYLIDNINMQGQTHGSLMANTIEIKKSNPSKLGYINFDL